FDTTLRDGQQTPGIDFSLEDKLVVIGMLDELGVDYIEGGYAGGNPTDTQLFATPRNTRATFTAFGMTKRAGRSVSNDPGLQQVLAAQAPAAVRYVWTATRPAVGPCILCGSDHVAEDRLRRAREAVDPVVPGPLYPERPPIPPDRSPWRAIADYVNDQQAKQIQRIPQHADAMQRSQAEDLQQVLDIPRQQFDLCILHRQCACPPTRSGPSPRRTITRFVSRLCGQQWYIRPRCRTYRGICLSWRRRYRRGSLRLKLPRTN
ncbi:MAG: hypothetical protein ACKPKO_20305, partial [Candidatus Fonsibacter sp.]